MNFDEIINKIQNISEVYLIDKPYIVGGLPRDIYLKKEIKTNDIDITTNSADVLRLGIMFSTEVTSAFDLSDDGHITVFTEKYDVDFSSNFISEKVVEHLAGNHKGLEEVFSRDFTMNTLHYDLKTKKIIDPTGMGFKDLTDHIVRTPVPPEITLTDDPRRVYRAINLAARYGYEISDDIIDFVKNNNEVFSSIKEKYISSKISTSLVENEDLTLRLLKELDLFKYVPLSGRFKEVLIRKKMLSEFLSSNAIDKFASNVDSSWDTYASQGPAYQKIAEWWSANSAKFGRPKKYSDWTKWYMSLYNTEWNRQHKSPEEVFKIMNDFVSGAKKDVRTEVEQIMNSAKPDASRTPKRVHTEKIPYSGVDKVYTKAGVNITNVTRETKEFIRQVGIASEQLNAEIPIITSGWRSLESQASLMYKNWQNNGGKAKGRAYLTGLYGQRYGSAMADVFETRTGDQLMRDAIAVIKQQSVGSYHISDPGRAIDFALTAKIFDVLKKAEKDGNFNIKIVDETKKFGPHWHVTVHGKK